MSPRTAPLVALDDRTYWRRLLATVHPDRDNGDSELFVWLTALREHVEGCAQLELPASSRYGEAAYPQRATGDRIPYDASLGAEDEFWTLTHRTLSIGQRVEEPFRSLLALLIDCGATDHGRRAERQCRGATYKQLQLAAIAYMVPLTKEERCRWYEIARVVPLSELHASHILGELKHQETAA